MSATSASALHIPPHVHMAVAPHGNNVLLDRRTGRCYTMNRTAHDLWQEWHRTGDFDTALAALAARDPSYASSRFHNDSRELAAMMLAKGLLARTTPVPKGAVTETPARVVDSACPTFRLTAVFAFLITILLVRLPFRVTVRVLSWSRSRWCRRGATAGQALAAMRATDAVGRYYPGRVACLELSLATVVTMALGGRHLSLVVGIADDPCRFHAWVMAEDGPVSYPSDSDIAEFRPITIV
jgi:hypothetical protein